LPIFTDLEDDDLAAGGTGDAYGALGVSSHFTGKYASSVRLSDVIGEEGRIIVIIHGFPTGNDLNGAIINYTPTDEGSNITWTVDSPTGDTNVPTKYLPRT